MLELFASSDDAVVPHTAIAGLLGAMFVLAAVDVWKQEIEDLATAAALLLVAGGLVIDGVHLDQWVGGVLTAAVAFLAYLLLGMRGLMGGGDVKLSVVPALVLGTVAPLLGIWWIAVALLIQQALFHVSALTQRTPAAAGSNAVPMVIPHVPAMALAATATIAIFPPFW